MNIKLKSARKKIGFTQLEVAEKANISLRAYQNYEAGERVPNVYTAQRLAKVLGSNNVRDLFPICRIYNKILLEKF